MIRILSIIVSIFFMAGCASKQPVLYPNAHYKTVGAQVAKVDVEECFRLAEEAVTQGDKGEELAAKTGKSAVVGGATGAVAGAITGSVGRGSLVGVAIGGTSALVGGAFKANDHDPIFMRFVEQCLAEKGYQVLGWR